MILRFHVLWYRLVPELISLLCWGNFHGYFRIQIDEKLMVASVLWPHRSRFILCIISVSGKYKEYGFTIVGNDDALMMIHEEIMI